MLPAVGVEQEVAGAAAQVGGEGRVGVPLVLQAGLQRHDAQLEVVAVAEAGAGRDVAEVGGPQGDEAAKSSLTPPP